MSQVVLLPLLPEWRGFPWELLLRSSTRSRIRVRSDVFARWGVSDLDRVSLNSPGLRIVRNFVRIGRSFLSPLRPFVGSCLLLCRRFAISRSRACSLQLSFEYWIIHRCASDLENLAFAESSLVLAIYILYRCPICNGWINLYSYQRLTCRKTRVLLGHL